MIDFEYCRYKLNNQIGTHLVGWMIKLMFFLSYVDDDEKNRDGGNSKNLRG